MPLKATPPSQRFPLRTAISSSVLLLLIVAIALAIRKPVPVSLPQSTAARQINAQSFETKISQLEQPVSEGDTASEVRLTSDEVRAAFEQSAAAESSSSPSPVEQRPAASSSDLPQIEAPQVSFEGDEVKGQFVTEMSGKKIYVTVNGRLGAKDGYVTFEPTEFKVGDLKIPVSLVNGALQKKMLEQHERMKLPDSVSDLKVQNGELVITHK